MKYLKTYEAFSPKRDIVITLPDEIDWNDYEKEIVSVQKPGKVLNYKVSTFPKHSGIGNRCYMCHKGHVKGWMKIVGMSEKEFVCEVTKKKSKGKFIERGGKFYKVDPIPLKGFKGYMYYDRDRVLKI